MDFKTLGQASDIPAGTMKAFALAGKDILVANIDGKLYAIDRYCTHRQGDLSLGKLEGKIVTCPRHSSQFDITTGKNVRGPKIGPVRTTTADESSYSVKIDNGEIRVKI